MQDVFNTQSSHNLLLQGITEAVQNVYVSPDLTRFTTTVTDLVTGLTYEFKVNFTYKFTSTSLKVIFYQPNPYYALHYHLQIRARTTAGFGENSSAIFVVLDAGKLELVYMEYIWKDRIWKSAISSWVGYNY